MRYLIHLTAPFAALLASPAFAGGTHTDEPLLTSVSIDQLEYRKNGGSGTAVLKSGLWMGSELEKFGVRFEGEKQGKEATVEVQALYSRAVAPYWDLQAGVRQDFEPNPERSWVVLGLQGLAPYFLAVDAALFLGESGRTALRLEVEYDLLLTQRWILSPQVELNFLGEKDEALNMDSGLATTEAGLRLRYEIRREFAPYLGVNWQKSSGESSETQWLVGIRAWF
jgi:copper resistance protein B